MNPDWVIFGISSDSDGVVLYASSSLSAIELEAQYESDCFEPLGDTSVQEAAEANTDDEG